MGMNLELYGRRRDGTEVAVEISLSPLETAQGILVSAAIRDVTERKRANEARLQLAAIVESSDDAIIGNSLDGIITSWNKGAERIYGYTAEEVTGRAITILLPPDRSQETLQILQTIKNGESLEHYETARVTKDHREVDVSLTVSPVRDQAGNIVGGSTIARDITERKKLDKKLAALNEDLRRRTTELETANKELESFAYSVSHDLRAPLRHVQGFTQLLQQSAATLDDASRHYLQTIIESTRRLGQLIDDLLALSRVGRAELHMAAVNLDQVAQHALKELAGETNGRPIVWKIDSLPTVYGDLSLLRAVFTNLLSNALKFTRHRLVPCIQIGCHNCEGSEAVVYVRDNGVGFDMKYAGKLFGVFQRLHSAEEFKGTGIGLASVHRTIHRHGGRVWAEGKVGEGATFYFSLPKY